MIPMTAESFRLYDTLNCAATAVDEAESGRRDRAETAWQEARKAAAGLFAEDGILSGALAEVLAAAAPEREGEYRGWLWNALSAVSLAVLPAMEGDPATTALCMLDADEAVLLLPADLRDALSVILGVVRAMAGMEVAA